MTAKIIRAVVTARVALVTMIEERLTSLRCICVFSALALRSLLPCLLCIAEHELGLFEKVNFVIPNIVRAVCCCLFVKYDLFCSKAAVCGRLASLLCI